MTVALHVVNSWCEGAMFKRLIKLSVEHPWSIIVSLIVITIFSLIQYPKIKVDTDPENMLSEKRVCSYFS